MIEEFIEEITQCDKDRLLCKIGSGSKRVSCVFPYEFLHIILKSFSSGCDLRIKGVRHHPTHKLQIISVKYIEKKIVKEVPTKKLKERVKSVLNSPQALKDFKESEEDRKKIIEDIKKSMEVTQEMLSRKVTI